MTILETLKIRWHDCYEAYCPECGVSWPVGITHHDYQQFEAEWRWDCPDCGEARSLRQDDIGERNKQRWVVTE